jgi:hypothetical protein
VDPGWAFSRTKNPRSQGRGFQIRLASEKVLWKGNRGRTYFYQSEIPYDPPAQASYTSAQGVNGWASYKVANEVTNHEAWGLGVYSVFIHPNVVLTRAIETPKSQEIRFHDIITVALGEHGVISHVINDTGDATAIRPSRDAEGDELSVSALQNPSKGSLLDYNEQSCNVISRTDCLGERSQGPQSSERISADQYREVGLEAIAIDLLQARLSLLIRRTNAAVPLTG